VTPERWQEVKKVLAGALERAPADRHAYLDQTCSDPALRREVESLILQHEQSAGSFLAQPAFQMPAFQIKLLETGSRLGPYEILAQIGSGGMGVVYRARDSRLERDVAIKVLSSGLLTDESARRRFRKEALALAKLNHANIASIYDVGEQDGVDYLVMECVSGQSLAEKVKSGPLTEKEIASSGGQIAAALEEAHEHGIVHRDLKPANVMFTPKGQAKVLDFGLAKLLLPFDAATTQTIGESQAIAGTLPYMAPEQLQGEPVDGRTDIHALGLVLYEVASGRRLFQQESVPQLTDAILHQQPVTPRAFNARVSPELERIILKCLEKDPDNRYQSAKELAVDLRRLGAPSSFTSARTPVPTPAPTLAPPPVSPSPPPVPVASSPSPAPASARAPRRARWPILAGTLIAAVVIALGAWLFFSRRVHALTNKDTIVLADFTNATGDPVFDGTLRQGLSVQLEQSPFLSVISDQQVQQTLQLMDQKPDAKLTPPIAQELCQRAGSAAVLDGSIGQIGTQYLLTVKAVNCSTGATLASVQAQSSDKNHVLDALGQTAAQLRSKLGESLNTVQQFNTPLEQATTPSLDALEAYSAGLKVLNTTGSAAAIPFFKHAIELDPKFAIAYAWLGRMFADVGEAGMSADATRKAFELRDRTSEAEKYFIESSYEMLVTGNMVKAEQTCELWIQAYPRSQIPHSFLSGVILGPMGQYNRIVEEAKEAIRLDPTFPISYAILMTTYIPLDRLDEAMAVDKQAVERGLDSPFLHMGLYQIAFLRNDMPGMSQQVTWSAGKPGVEDLFLGLATATAAYHGRLGQARELNRQAEDSNEQSGQKEAAALYSAGFGAITAWLGNADEARRYADLGLQRSTGRDVVYLGALALACADDRVRAQTLADDLAKKFPEDTMVQFSYLPELRAKLALGAGNPSEALEALQAAAPYELGGAGIPLYPAYVRGEAYLAARNGAAAAAEFQKIIDHPGVVTNQTIGALAHLEIGRAYAMQAQSAPQLAQSPGARAAQGKARAAYQDFFALWKDADPNIPVLIAAKSEYAKLPKP
jgi:eukaryotic-like serine/threonine-protein kinase